MTRPGAVAEWLGRGLQSLVHQFDSGRRLLGLVSVGSRWGYYYVSRPSHASGDTYAD